MSEHESLLLRRFAEGGDAEAFSEITRLYAGMVYGVCLRVTGDAEHARDATQDTFFQLLKQAGKVTDSLGGWLHQVATRRAVDLVRRDSARRRREWVFATETVRETDVWADVSPLVDEAMNEIETAQRDLLLRHFLQGESTVQMAAAEGVSQPTMSRRVAGALEQLRERLRKKGVGVAAAVLGTMMAGTLQEVPAALLAELGKMALVTSGMAAASTATATAVSLNAKLAIAAVIAVVGAGGYVIYKATRPAKSAPPVMASAQPATTPVMPANFQTIPAATPASVTPVTTTPGSTGTGRFNGPAPPQVMGGGGIQSGWVPYGGGVRLADQPIGFGGMAMGSAAPSSTTPDGAVTRFVSALMRGDPARLSECFDGTIETNMLRRVLENPVSDEEHDSQQAFKSLGTPVEVVGTTTLEDGLRLRCRATVRKSFTLVNDGITKTWQPGDRFELNILMKQVGNVWKVVGF